jgi:hypothetical protein
VATPTPATLDEFLSYLGKSFTPTEQDALASFLEGATEAAEGWRNVGPIVAREFTERVRVSNGRLVLLKTPVQSVTSATRISDDLLYEPADLDIDGETGVVTAVSGTISPGEYTVVYDAGRDPVPAKMKQAVLIIAGHHWETQQGPTSDRFVGGEDNRTPRVHRGYLIPRRAAELLESAMSVVVM